MKKKLLLTYDVNEKVDNKNIKARPGDSSLPITIIQKNLKKYYI